MDVVVFLIEIIHRKNGRFTCTYNYAYLCAGGHQRLIRVEGHLTKVSYKSVCFSQSKKRIVKKKDRLISPPIWATGIREAIND